MSAERNTILIKNVASITVCLNVLFLSYFQAYKLINFILSSYLFVDLFHTTKPDFIIHHLSTLGFLYSTRNVPLKSFYPQAPAMINLEISTVFLAIDALVTEQVLKLPKWLVYLNQALFTVTFTKFRIWDYFWRILIVNEYPNGGTKTAVLTLFLLDCYWFCLICRRLKKTILNTKNA